MAARVETVRRARPEQALPDTFGSVRAWRDVGLDPERLAWACLDDRQGTP